MNYTTNEKIKEYLINNYFQNLKKADVNDLLKWWRNMVDRVEKEGDIDEYWNDLSTREAIEKIIDFIDPKEKPQFLEELEKIDNDFKSKTLELDNPFRVEKPGVKYEGFWFDFRAPKYLVESEKLKTKN